MPVFFCMRFSVSIGFAKRRKKLGTLKSRSFLLKQPAFIYSFIYFILENSLKREIAFDKLGEEVENSCEETN